MLTIEGVRYKTVKDAAAALGVSVKAVDGYIDRGIISPPPPTVFYGIREVRVFPDDYLARAHQQIADYRAKNRKRRRK